METICRESEKTPNLVDSSRSLASSVWAQRLCKLKINLWGRVFGVYMCSRKLPLKRPKTVEWKWSVLTPASGELQSGPRPQLPPTPTSLQLPKGLPPPFPSDWRVSSKAPQLIGSEVHSFFTKQKKILNSSSVLQWQWRLQINNGIDMILQKWQIGGCFKCWVDVSFVPRCSRLSTPQASG